MTIRKTAVAWAATTGVLLIGAPAMAGFWTPLDTVPRPNFIVGLDTSVTMGIRSDCSSCHGPSNPNTRLNEAKTDILNTLPMFRNYFVFGGFQYSGCSYAKINTRVLPRPDNPPLSYAGVTNMVSSAGHCGSRENTYPGGGGASAGCITPTAGCAGDPPVLSALMSGALPGLSVPAPAIPDPTVNLACDTASPPQPTYNLAASMLGKLGAGNFGWPRWDAASLNGTQVLNELCTPLSNVLNQINAELNACFVDPTTVWDLSFLGGGFGGWCTPGTIAGNACTAVSVLNGTCVCDDTIAGCVSAAMPSSECGTLLTWKARQQVAVCEMYSTASAGRLGSYYLSQADNIANGECRENVGLFLTDGYEGHKAGVGAEAINALNFYRSADGLANLFVFRISNVFGSDANTMMNYVTGGQIGAAYLATDPATMQESFAKVLSRIYKGVYTGANMATDQYQTRAVFHSFTVPGYNPPPAPVTDSYLGFPSRISVHEIMPDGSINASPRFESDWTSRVTANPGCGPFTVGGTDVTRLGPNGSFRNGVARGVTLGAGTTDRDGDGVADGHPGLTYGRSYGFAAGGALVVDAPRAANPGTDAGEVSDYINFVTNLQIQQRPRVIYYTDGGYLLGIHGGTYQPGTFNYGTQKMNFEYDDSGAPAGAEVLRYRPGWLNNPTVNYTYAVNDLLQQPLMTGELLAREARVRVSGTDMYRTVLLGNQGKEGPGYFAVDVTPIDAGGNFPSMAGGRKYFTSPVAYFGTDGEVNLVFGSGDYQNLTSAPASNALFRVRDATTRQAGVPPGNTRLDQVCWPDGGGATSGMILLGAGERVLSKPIVASGVVAWTTYVSTTDGCVAGNGMLYAMDFETCQDVLNPGNPRPSGTNVGAGIPTSPVLHRQSESLLVQSSAGPTGGQVGTQAATTRTAGKLGVKRLYWRLDVDNP